MNEKYTYIFPPIPDKNFPIYIEKQCYTGQKEIFRSHWHEHFELIFMISGKLNLNCNANSIDAKTGDLLIINPNDLHNLYSLSQKVEYYCIIFDINLIQSISNDSTDINYLRPLIENRLIFNNFSKYNNSMYNCARDIFSEYEGSSSVKHFIIKAKIMELMGLVFSNCDYSNINSNIKNNKRSNQKLMQNILLHLNKNYKEQITLEGLAEEFNISYHHICHIFKDFTNKSVMAYVTEQRIEKSLHLLETTTLPISEIAALVGYQDSNYYSRVFKKTMNMSPREYIKKSLIKN